MWIHALERRLEARWVGTPGARALVFLHEGLGSAAQWRDFPDAVAAATGLPALVYSRAGYGRSDPVELPRPLDYMEQEGAHALPAVLAAAGIQEPVLIGHSDGGTIALCTAADHPVRALVTLAPHVRCEALSVSSIAAAREAYEHGDLREKLAKHHDHVDVAFWGWNRAWLDPAFVQWSIEPLLPRITAPVLAIQCADDPYGTPAQVHSLAERVAGPAEVLLFPEGGHAPHRAHREATLAAIVRHVASTTL